MHLEAAREMATSAVVEVPRAWVQRVLAWPEWASLVWV